MKRIPFVEVVRKSIILLIGVYCLLAAFYYRQFAHLHIQVPVLDIPIFINEILLFICVLGLGYMALRTRSYKKKHYVVFAVFFVWILVKVGLGIVKYPECWVFGLRNAALFYYILFGLVGYICFRPDDFNKKLIGLILALLIGTKLLGINVYFLFPYLCLSFLLLSRIKNKWVQLALIVPIIFLPGFYFKHNPLIPFAYLFGGSRSRVVGHILGVLFLVISFSFLYFPRKRAFRYIIPGCAVILLIIGVSQFSDKNALKSMTSITKVTKAFRQHDEKIREKGEDSEPLDLEVKLYSEEQITLGGKTKAYARRVVPALKEEEKKFREVMKQKVEQISLEEQQKLDQSLEKMSVLREELRNLEDKVLSDKVREIGKEGQDSEKILQKFLEPETDIHHTGMTSSVRKLEKEPEKNKEEDVRVTSFEEKVLPDKVREIGKEGQDSEKVLQAFLEPETDTQHTRVVSSVRKVKKELEKNKKKGVRVTSFEEKNLPDKVREIGKESQDSEKVVQAFLEPETDTHHTGMTSSVRKLEKEPEKNKEEDVRVTSFEEELDRIIKVSGFIGPKSVVHKMHIIKSDKRKSVEQKIMDIRRLLRDSDTVLYHERGLAVRGKVANVLAEYGRQEEMHIESIVALAQPQREHRSLDTAYNNILFRLFIWRDMIVEILDEGAWFSGVNFARPQRSRSLEVLGWGQSAWRKDGWITPHNSYLHYLYRGGVVGLLVICGLIYTVVSLIRSFIVMRSISGILLMGIFIYWMAIANFLVFFEFPYNAIPFWTLLGMTVAYREHLKEKVVV